MNEVQGPTTPAARVTDDRFLDCLSSAAGMVGARRFREAEIEVLRALSITPSDLRALKLLALVRFKLGRLDEARALCRELAARLPRDAGIRLKLGLIALKLDRVDDSVMELETAARLAPEDLRPWSYLGYAYARRGDRARAAAAFRRAGQESLARESEGNGEGNSDVDGEGDGEGESARVSGGESTPGPDRSGRSMVGSTPGSAGNGGWGTRLTAATGSGALTVAPAGMGLGPGAGGRPGTGLAAAFSASAGAVPSMAFEPAFDQSMPQALGGHGLVADGGLPLGVPERLPSRGRGGSGALPVAPLVGFAVSRLSPPADQAAWVGAAARLAITDGAFVRADAAVACAGVVRWEEANRRVHGRPTGERLGGPDAPFFRVRGRAGELFVSAPPGTGRLVPLMLEDDVLYVREDAVLAFEGTVSWEYGHIPRSATGMLQFRGRGLVAVCVRGEPGSIKVSPERPVQASARNLLGWVGRVVAHGGLHDVGISPPHSRPTSAGPMPITCEGEGVVLLDVEIDRGRQP